MRGILVLVLVLAWAGWEQCWSCVQCGQGLGCGLTEGAQIQARRS